ncbi:MAG TPA: alpha/beta fold hydrolase [Vicinamibacteria bacterium]
MGRTESFDFDGPAGRLEAILMWPDRPPEAAAVVCHAHPLHGGVMHFKPVFRTARALQLANVAALRFNFRGVGRSEGLHDQGRGEQEDVRAALAEVARRVEGVPLLVGGFSFGSVMALRVAARDSEVQSAFALGFPAAMVQDLDFLQEVRVCRLFVQGEHDEFAPATRIRELVEMMPQPHRLVIVPGSDHYFAGKLDVLQSAVQAWASERPWRHCPS